MLHDSDSAAKVAQYLLDIKAVKLSPESPFQWASGWKSPIYCDNRRTMAFPSIRTYLKETMGRIVNERFQEAEIVIGVATGGIGIGALLAEHLEKPFGYVRSSAKGHGMQNRVEGAEVKGKRIVVIEDLISTGGSSLSAVEALREAGAEVLGMIAIFSYGFDLSAKRMAEADVPLITLSDYPTMIEQATAQGLIQVHHEQTLGEWRRDPANWRGQIA